MTKLEILATLTGEVSQLSYVHTEVFKLHFFTFGALSHRQNITGPEDPPPTVIVNQTPQQ